MIIEIKYKDKKNWLSLNGLVTNWENFSSKFKDKRIQPAYLVPEETTGVWNGIEHDVQHIRWDVYRFDMYIQEGEIHDINRIRSCKDIEITEYTKKTDGSILSKSYEVDTSVMSYFNISEPEQIADTSSWKISVIFRTNKTVINYGDPIDNLNYISMDTGNWQNLYSKPFVSGQNQIAALSELRIVAINAGVLTLLQFGVNGWIQLGNTLDTGLTTDVSITRLDENNFALVGESKLEKYTFDGANFIKLGNTYTFSVSKVSPKITNFDNNSIAIIDLTDKKLECYEFDGFNWDIKGNALSITMTATQVSISSHSSTDLVFYDNGNKKIRNYTWDGTDFVKDFETTATATDFLLCALNPLSIAFVDRATNILYKYTSSGTAYVISTNTYALETKDYVDLIKISSDNILLITEGLLYEWIKSIETTAIISADDTRAICKLTDTRCVIVCQNSQAYDIIACYELADNNWVKLGNEFQLTNPGESNYLAVTSLNSNTIVLVNPYRNTISVYSFDGTNWSLVGNEYTLDTYKPSIQLFDTNTIVLNDILDQYIRVLLWDGTDFTPVGNSYSTPYFNNPSKIQLIVLSSSLISIWNPVFNNMQNYSWDGTDFTPDTLYAGFQFSQFAYISLIETNSIAVIDPPNFSLKKFNFIAGSWTQVSNTYFSNDLFGCNSICQFNNNNSILTLIAQTITSYEFSSINNNLIYKFNSGNKTYYTDFDIVNSVKETEQIKVDWSDGTKKIIRTENHETKELLFYFNSNDKQIFLRDLKLSTSTLVSGASVLDYEIEVNQVGHDYHSIILRCLTALITKNFDLSPNNTYNLRVVNGSTTYNFYTDYVPELIDENPEIEAVNNGNGINASVKNISKVLKKVVFFENESDAFEIKKRFELGGTITLDGASVKESRAVNPEKLAYNLYKVEVNCLMDALLSY